MSDAATPHVRELKRAPSTPEFVVLGNVSGPIIFTVVPAIIAVLLYAVLLRSTRIRSASQSEVRLG